MTNTTSQVTTETNVSSDNVSSDTEIMTNEPVYNWREIQVQTYHVKPTIEMLTLGKKLPFKAWLKGEPRKGSKVNGDIPVRVFSFDRDYVLSYLVKKFFLEFNCNVFSILFRVFLESYGHWCEKYDILPRFTDGEFTVTIKGKKWKVNLTVSRGD